MLRALRGGAPARLARLTTVAVVLAAALAVPVRAQECAERVDEGAFASRARIRGWNKVMADAGVRPTASPAHHSYVRWLESRLKATRGVSVRSRYESIDRWLERGAGLTVMPRSGGRKAVRVSGAVPYSRPASVRGPLTYLPPGTVIADNDVKGKIVVRDALPGTGPQAIFFAVAYYVHDPDLTLDYAGNYERDFSGYLARVTDLREAAAGGAAGVVFAHTIPYEQVRGNYQPYE
ncbi:MAG: hypothetical protein ACRDKJ_14435, partial [Actinomycetota bacterium]